MLPGIADALGVDIMEFFENSASMPPEKKSKADQLRRECELVLRRTKSEEALQRILNVLKVLKH
jgi:hypothetical protein